MSRRVGNYSEVKLFSRHVAEALAYPGFGNKQTVKAMLDRDEMACDKFNPADYNLGVYGNGQMGTVAFLKLGGQHATACAKPLADFYAAQSIDASYYTLSGGSWQDIVGAEYADHIMYQEDGNPAVTDLRTNWCFGTNPIFVVGLWRGEANRAWVDAGSTDAWEYATWVRFGGAFGTGVGDPGQFSLRFPYGGQGGMECYAWNPYTAAWTDSPLQLIEGSQALQAPQGMPAGQRMWLCVACFRDAIWVSTDGFVGQVAGYHIPEAFRDATGTWRYPAHRKNVQSGPVWIVHTAGQWAATVYPVWMPNTTAGCTPYAYGAETRALYRIADNAQNVAWQAWTDLVIDDAGAGLQDVAVTVETVDDYARRAKVQLEPVVWQLACSDYAGTCPQTYTSPALHAIQLTQAPYTYATGQSVTSTVYDTRHDIALDWKEIGKPASGRIGLHNPGGIASGVQDYQRVQVTLGERLDDGTNTSAVVYTGYVVTPGDTSGRGDTNRLELHTFDAITRLDDLKAIGDEPDFSVLTPDAGVKWLLGRALVPSAAISGAGTTGLVAISDYNPEGDDWTMAAGRPYREMVRKILDAGTDTLSEADRGGALFLRYSAAPAYETWVRTSGPFTTTGVAHTLTERVPSDYASSVYHIYSLRRDRHGASDSDYANHITVIGGDRQGKQAPFGVWGDTTSISPSSATFAGGWWHTRVERDPAIKSISAALTRAGVLASQIGTAREYVTVETDLLPTVTFGQVFQLSGTATGKVAAASCNGAKYRVEQYGHKLSLGTMARTTLTGRRLPD